MLKALGSKIRLNTFDTDLSMDYFVEVNDLLFSKPVQALADWEQHMHISRLQHSINVSYYSFLICRKLGLNSRAAARGGLLHDLFFFNWRDENLGSSHIKLHPQVALENAEQLCDLTDMERDIIAKHMWPCGGRALYRETLIVSFVDKFCATSEFFDFLRLAAFNPMKR